MIISGSFFFKDVLARHKMKKSVSGLKTFSFGQDLVFEGYIQYKVSLRVMSLTGC